MNHILLQKALNLKLDIVFIYLAFILMTRNKLSSQAIPSVNSFILIISNTLLLCAAYLINKASDTEEDTLNNEKNHFKNSTFIYSSMLCYVASFIGICTYADRNIIPYYMIIYAISILYSYPKKIRLKNIFLIKNIAPALCWYLSFSLLVFSFLQKDSLLTILNFLIPYLFFFTLIEIIWDIPDVQGDSRTGIKTLPVIIGVKKTKIIIGTLLAGLCFIAPKTFIPFTIPTLLFFTLTKDTTQKEYYRYYLVILTLILCLVSLSR